MEYTVDYFIKKFEAIDQLGEGGISEGCALAKCGCQSYVIPMPEEAQALCSLLTPLASKVWDEFSPVYNINDGGDPRYQQPTPKQRILAALRDIKAKQEKPIIPVFTSLAKKHEAEAVHYAREIAKSLLTPETV